MKKSSWITILIILGVIILSIIIINKPTSGVSEEIAKCIGENSFLYVQLGCSHCETQEKMFGKNYQYLDSTDCFYEREKCSLAEIRGTPTWIINDVQYTGVQTIEKLQELTGCN